MVALVLMLGCDSTPQEPADLVLQGGKVVTVDSAMPEAEAVAVRGDRIVAVGATADVSDLIGPDTRVIDLEGRLLIPGFIEGHAHYLSLGQSKLTLDLGQAATWDDIVAMVEAAAADAEPGDWILGRGWHQEKWDPAPEGAIEGVPPHDALSAVSPDNPVYLTHASGHAAFVNARAMELAGIDRNYTPPEGGEVVRDARGEPTGLLRESADAPVSAALNRWQERQTPEERQAQFERVVQLAGEEALSKGITSFHDAGAGFGTIDRYLDLAEAGRLPVRLYVMVRASNDELAGNLADYRMIGAADEFLTVRSIKKYMDGALGSHGAWLLEPYTDMPSSTGLVQDPVEDIAETARLALEYGYQVNTHAIGDRANREVLDIYETAFESVGGPADRRWRIEHAQHIDPADLPRFAELGVVAAMQAVHGTSDSPWVPKRLGEERANTGAYRWQDLWQSGAVVGNGTDAPVEDVDPIPCYWASISRKLPDGSRFTPDQRLTREQALQAYTLNNAIAAFEEDSKGSITPGKLADMVILDRDILTVPEDEVLEAKVLMTILDGVVVYERAPESGA
jgi:predicted amidohydrolase YtcJ